MPVSGLMARCEPSTVAPACAKAAILTGPSAARDWLPHGGAVVLEDGSRHVLTA